MEKEDLPTIANLTSQQRMWNAMRILKNFSVIDIQVTARGDEDLLKESTVHTYISVLYITGYLEKIENSNWYKMVKNTGYFSPVRQRNGYIKDLNNGKETRYKPIQNNLKKRIKERIYKGEVFTPSELSQEFKASKRYVGEIILELRKQGLSLLNKDGKEGQYQWIEGI